MYEGLDSYFEDWTNRLTANQNILTADQRKVIVEDLKDQIDEALRTRDKQWFMELTEKIKEYEVQK